MMKEMSFQLLLEDWLGSSAPDGGGGGGHSTSQERGTRMSRASHLYCLELVVFACFATIGQSFDWREPIGLQERLKGRSSHNGEISVMSRSRSQGTEVTIVTGAFSVVAWRLTGIQRSRWGGNHSTSQERWTRMFWRVILSLSVIVPRGVAH